MADLYVSDSVYALFVSEYGNDAKEAMRDILQEQALGESDE